MNFGIPEPHFRLRITESDARTGDRRIDPEAISPSPIVAILDFCEVPQGFQCLTCILRYSQAQCQHSRASSTDRCNTFCEFLSRRLIEQGLSRPFIELPCDGTKLGLTVQGQIGATRKILAQQSVGVFV